MTDDTDLAALRAEVEHMVGQLEKFPPLVTRDRAVAALLRRLLDRLARAEAERDAALAAVEQRPKPNVIQGMMRIGALIDEAEGAIRLRDKAIAQRDAAEARAQAAEAVCEKAAGLLRDGAQVAGMLTDRIVMSADSDHPAWETLNCWDTSHINGAAALEAWRAARETQA